MRIHIRVLSLYIFSLLIMYLAGVYFGKILFLLFSFFCTLPVLSFIVLIIWYRGLELTQTFSTYVPVKGEVLIYTLMVINRSFIPLPTVQVVFTSVGSTLDAQLSSFSIGVEPGTGRKKSYKIRCLYRGTYKLGVRVLEIQDFLKLVTLKKKIRPENLSVFPRIIALDPFSQVASITTGNGKYTSAGMLQDPTLFRQLREYREGDSIRHIYWKKYASIGKPVLKEYDRTKRTGTRVYFDTRKNTRHGINVLEQEDVSVEILVALTHYLLDHNVYTTVVAPGWDSGSIVSDESKGFDDLYKATIELEFANTASPVAAYYEDRQSGNLESQTVIFITHIIDPEIFALRDHAREHELHFIINGAGYWSKDLMEIQTMLHSVSEYGADGLCIRSADTIREDLRQSVTREFS